jgi:hypothetical protein
MKKGFFIQTNKKQLLGAKLAQYAFEETYKGDNEITTTIMQVEDIFIFNEFKNKTYLRGGREITADENDLQSFTLTRFLPPSLMNFEGRVVVIDPDIFALKDISPLFEMDLEGRAIAACRKKGAFDSSVMVLDCEKLKHWDVELWLQKLANKEMDYEDIMTLKNELNILEIGREWNDLDHLDENTKMLHTTNRLTQPWKMGLPIDFRRNPLPKLFGIIPRELIHKLLGKRPNTYQQHPNKEIEEMFFKLVRGALQARIITDEFLCEEIENKHIRADIFDKLNSEEKANITLT